MSVSLSVRLSRAFSSQTVRFRYSRLIENQNQMLEVERIAVSMAV